MSLTPSLSTFCRNAQPSYNARLNLGELLEYSLLPFEPLFFEKGLELVADIQPNISVDGDGEQLRQAIDILLDNAQKYALAPDKVEISLRKNRHHCLLSVSNACEPMDKEETRNLFKRFYRTDKARSRDGSFGLGLPIAEGIVAEHRGRIRRAAATAASPSSSSCPPPSDRQKTPPERP